MASFMSLSLKTGRLIFIWPPDSLQCSAINHSVNASNLQICQTLMTLMRKLMLNFGHSQTHSLVRMKATGVELPIVLTGLGLSLDSAFFMVDGLESHLHTSHHSAAAGGLAACSDWSWLQRLNGVDAVGMEQGHPGPLGSMCLSMMAWAINHQPSPRLTGLGLS